MVNLFQKVAELETASRFNARASALATVLQNREALLLDFGQSQYFRKGESVGSVTPSSSYDSAKKREGAKLSRLRDNLLLQNRLRGAVGFKRRGKFRALRSAT